jgi:hypothetical protein
LGGRGRRISEFEANPVYKVSSRTARAIQRNTVSEKKKKNYILRTYYVPGTVLRTLYIVEILIFNTL